MISSLNTWIVEHQAVVVTLGLPLLTLLITQIATQSSDRRAARDRVADRQLSRDLHTAQSYKESIELCRSDMAEFLSMLMEWRFGKVVDSFDARRKLNQILLRLDPISERARGFGEIAERALNAKDHKDEFYPAYQELFDLSREIINENWKAMNEMETGKRSTG